MLIATDANINFFAFSLSANGSCLVRI